MTKKHFVRIAAIIKQAKAEDFGNDTFERGVIHGADYIALVLADYFETENPNFDAARFLEACDAK